MSGPDEKWVRGIDGEPYWRPSTAGEDRWLVIVGAQEPEPPTAAPEAPGPAEPPEVAAVAAPDPTPIPVTRAQRLRNLMDAVRSGDRSAADALRAMIGGDDAA